LKSFFATLETGWSGFFASSVINVVGEVQSSKTCRETMGDVDMDEDSMSEPCGGATAGFLSTPAVITLTLDHH